MEKRKNTFTLRVTMAFSAINTPYFETPLDIDSGNQYEFPSELRRTTNAWMLHYGLYPHFCAALVESEDDINRKLSGQGFTTERHVAQLYIGDHLTQRYVVHQIERIVTQLSLLPGITYEKKPSEIFVAMGTDNFTLRFFVCDDSGLFHVLLGKNSDEECDDLYTEDINKLILCIRALLQDNDPARTLPDITRAQWFRHGHMTKMPGNEIEEVVPEWLEDDVADWNFPEIEAEIAPVLLGDILEMM